MLVIRRGTDAERAAVTFAEGELVYTTDNQEVWIGDGSTAGGILVTGAGGGTIDDTAYDATTWNANLDGASKNAIRDQIETMLTAIALNTAKVTNATHTGEVTGSGALVVDKTAISGKSAVTIDAADYLLIGDSSDTDNLKKGLVSDIAYPAADAAKVAFISITGAVDLDQIDSDTTTNNAKVTNATHTGEVTGSGALTVDKTAITGKSLVTVDPADVLLISDDSDSGNLKKVAASDFLSPSVSVISPASITADQDDYAPTGFGAATYVRLGGDNGLRAITGLAAPTGSDPIEKTLVNVSAYMLYLPQDHPDSTAGNRFTGYPGDYYLYPGASAKILYDVTSSRWRVMSGDPGYARPTVRYDWSASSTTAGDNNSIAVSAMIAGGTAPAATASTTSLPAFASLSTASSSTGGSFIYLTKNVGTYSSFGAAHNFAEAIVSIPTLSDGTETYAAELQITNIPSSASTLENNNTIGIRYSHSINSGKWEVFTQSSSGSEDVADSGITVADATLYKLRIEIDKSLSEARGYINGVYIGKVETDLPNAVILGSRAIIVKSAGTTARTLNVHSLSAGAIYP